MSKKIRAAKINALSATMKRIKATFDAAEAEGTTGGLAVLAGQVETAMGILGDIKKAEEKEAARAAIVPAADEEGDEPKEGEDAEGDEPKEEGEDDFGEEEEGEDAEGEEGEGMDAAAVRRIVRTTQRQLAKGMTGKNMFADQVSSLIGSFDHSEMLTKSDVAKYAAGKLGLKPAKGHELTAVQSFLAAKNPAQPVARVTGMDSRTNKPSLVSAHLNSVK